MNESEGVQKLYYGNNGHTHRNKFGWTKSMDDILGETNQEIIFEVS